MASTPARPLARAGDPLVLLDGRIIQDPKARQRRLDLIKPKTTPASFKPTRQISAKELPAPIGVMKAVGVVFTLTMLGLGDREIAESLGITTYEVDEIRAHSAYSEVFSGIQGEFISANSELLQSRIAAYGPLALDVMEEVLVNGENEGNRLRASIDILDRAGTRPQDNAKHATSTNELRIVIVDNEKSVDVEINGRVL